jgi:c-di-GMP-binding flagellar brake protein YcgR
MSKRVVITPAKPSLQPGPLPAGAHAIEDMREIYELLGQATQQLCQVSVKIPNEAGGEDLQFISKLIDVAPAKGGLQVELPSGFPKKTKVKNCLLLIFTGRFLIGVQTEIERIGISTLVLRVPGKIFKLQRRRNVRYAVPGGYDITLDLESLEKRDTRVKRKVVDLSEGGIAFFVPTAKEAALYTVDAEFKDCHFKIRNQEVAVDLKIKNQISHEHAKRDGHKVGAEFVKISEDDRNFLATFIYSQLGQMLT